MFIFCCNNLLEAKPLNYFAHSTSDSLEFTDYYGTYIPQEIKQLTNVEITFQNEHLIAKAKGFPNVILIRKKDDEFEEQRFGLQVVFVRENYKVTAVKVLFQNKEIIALKE
jgi:hypothetical protein